MKTEIASILMAVVLMAVVLMAVVLMAVVLMAVVLMPRLLCLKPSNPIQYLIKMSVENVKMSGEINCVMSDET